MKTFTAFLFALLFCSNAVADNADRTKGAYDWDKLRNDISIYQNELEKCDKNFKEIAVRLLPKKSSMNNTANGLKSIKKRLPHIFRRHMISAEIFTRLLMPVIRQDVVVRVM